MNRFARLIKENLLPFVIFVIIAGACCCAWFFLHPSSPYHARYRFVVSYQAVGTLSPGNRVEVRGISRGQITKVELTEDAVYVTVEVLANTLIPKNSEFRLINSGLMGEREMCILTGDSHEYVADGDTLFGQFDEGMSGVSRKLSTIMGDVGEIRDSLRAFLDTLSDGSTGQNIDRVSNKADRLVKLTKSDVGEWKAEVDNLLEKSDASLESAKAALLGISSRAGAKINDVDNLLDRVQVLLSKVHELKDQSVTIMARLAKGDNSAGLLLDKNAQFNRQLDKLLSDVDALLKDVKKGGLTLNIDIF
jgi:phospholipid/cholesterol/gamma-HCH transport system substrate-binding protein